MKKIELATLIFVPLPKGVATTTKKAYFTYVKVIPQEKLYKSVSLMPFQTYENQFHVLSQKVQFSLHSVETEYFLPFIIYVKSILVIENIKNGHFTKVSGSEQ